VTARSGTCACAAELATGESTPLLTNTTWRPHDGPGERTKQVAACQAGALFVGLTYNCATQEIVLDCFREFGRQHSGVELAVQGMDSVSQMKALRR
jgi:hypothetical protein